MNKKKFIAELEKRLLILADEERVDIINEYSDIIEEKIKHGKTVEEAIQEFGDVDSLAKEILKAYKINTNYKTTDKKIKEVAEKSEDFVKKAAKTLSDATNNIIEEVKKSNLEITSQTVFEVILKILILLVGLSLLRIPFNLVQEIGERILSNDLFPFIILPWLWKLIIWIIYLISCALIVIVTFKDYFFKNRKMEPKAANKKNADRKQVKEEESNKELIIKEPKAEKNMSVVMIILQIFLVFTFFIPAIMFLAGWSVVLAVAIYLLIKGVNTVGIIVLTAGVFTITGFFFNLISSLFTNSKKVDSLSLVVGFILVIVGSLFTIELASGINYIDVIPSGFDKVKSTMNYNNKEKIIIENMEYEKLINENLSDGQVVIDIYYYNEYVTINRAENDDKIILTIDDYYENPSKIIKSIIKEIKNNKIYAYHDLYVPKLKIYTNSNTLDKIKIIEE